MGGGWRQVCRGGEGEERGREGARVDGGRCSGYGEKVSNMFTMLCHWTFEQLQFPCHDLVD